MRVRFVPDVHDKHNGTMGPELGPVFTALQEEVVELHIKLDEYRALFTKSPERVEILNKAAGSFFLMVSQVLWDNILLSVARLADPATIGKFENLTFAALVVAPPAERETDDPALRPLLTDEKLRNAVALAVAKARSLAQFAVAQRHKRLAHTDREQRLDLSDIPTQGSVEQAVNAATAFGEVLNQINLHFGGGDIKFDTPILGGAENLLRILKLGNDVRRNKFERWERGEYNADDAKGEPEI